MPDNPKLTDAEKISVLRAACLRAYEHCEPFTDGAPDAPESDKEAGRVAEQCWNAYEATQ